jgi:TolB protein
MAQRGSSDVRFWRGTAVALGLFVVVLGGLVARELAAPPPAPAVVERRVPVQITATWLAPTPAPVASLPPASPPAARVPLTASGTLAYALRRNGYSQLYALALPAAAPVRLTAGRWDDRDPAFSPDGRRLAFASRRDGNWELYLLELATGALQRITRAASFDGQPAWSPDGRWLAFATNRGGNLDVYITSLDGREVYQVTGDPLADYAPAWSPDGGRIAYTSWRSGNKDIWLTELSRAADDQAINLTRSPLVHEDQAAWSQAGDALVYADASSGYPLTYRLALGASGADGPPLVIAQGLDPAWAPGGEVAVAVVYPALAGEPAALFLGAPGGLESVRLGAVGPGRPRGLTWTAAALPPPAGSIAAASAALDPPLYVERVGSHAAATPGPRGLAALDGVEAPDARLSERVDDAFAALRARLIAESGWDYLGELEAAWQPPDASGDSDDDPLASLHPAGRAFDVIDSRAASVVVLYELSGGQLYWRLLVPAQRQDGSQGEPLTEQLWDLAARSAGGRARLDGGAPGPAPAGDVYYVDVTELAGDYGWSRLPAGEDWRSNWAATRAWHFERPDGLTWWQALLEVYALEELELIYGPAP